MCKCRLRDFPSSLTGYADGPAPELVDEAADDGPGAHVEAAEEAPHPRDRALVRVEVRHQHGQQDTEADVGSKGELGRTSYMMCSSKEILGQQVHDVRTGRGGG